MEAAARGWNREPTPFEWGGKRQARRTQPDATRLVAQARTSVAPTAGDGQHEVTAITKSRDSLVITWVTIMTRESTSFMDKVMFSRIPEAHITQVRVTTCTFSNDG